MGIGIVFKWSLRNWYDDMAIFAGAGVLSCLAQLPLWVLTSLVFGVLDLPMIALVFFVPFFPGPGLAGLHGLARELSRGEGISWGLFWDITKSYWVRSSALFVISLAGTVLLFFSLKFYLSSGNAVLQAIGFAWLYGLVLWLIMQLYLMPLLLEQERGNLLRTYRNAFFLAAAKPLLSLAVLIASMLLLMFGYFTLIGLPLVVLPFAAVLANHTVRFVIDGPPKRPQ